MVYTSYYAKLNKFPSNVVPISISKGIPSWYIGKSYNRLAPKWDTVKKYKDGGTWEDYIHEYHETVLDLLDQREVYDELMRLSNGLDVVLLCYEKSTDNCHRHIVAECLRTVGIDCEEYKF